MLADVSSQGFSLVLSDLKGRTFKASLHFEQPRSIPQAAGSWVDFQRVFCERSPLYLRLTPAFSVL